MRNKRMDLERFCDGSGQVRKPRQEDTMLTAQMYQQSRSYFTQDPPAYSADSCWTDHGKKEEINDQQMDNNPGHTATVDHVPVTRRKRQC